MADDVLLNKAAAIERAIARVREEYGADDGTLTANRERLGDFGDWTRLLLALAGTRPNQ